MAISPRKSSSHAAYQAGLAAFETGRYSEAIELLASVAEEAGLPATLARFYLGQAHMQQGIVDLRARRFREAAEHLAKARQFNPDSGSLPRYLTDCYVGLNRFDMAAREMEADDSSGDGLLPVRLAHALLRDGQLHRAIDALRSAIQAEPLRAELRYHIGLIYASVDDWATARDALVSAARLDPKNAQIARQLGLAYAATNDSIAAVACLQTAQTLAPHDANIAWLYALSISAAREQGHHIAVRAAEPTIHSASDDDLGALGEVLIREPDFVESFLALPAAQVDQELFAIITATLEKALARHPDYADLHYHCARAYERLGQVDAAIEKANRALCINRRYVQALIALGRLYAATDRTVDAEERLRQAISAGGDYPDVHYMLGELLRKRGQATEAAAEYRRALELNSNYSVARRALELVAA